MEHDLRVVSGNKPPFPNLLLVFIFNPSRRDPKWYNQPWLRSFTSAYFQMRVRNKSLKYSWSLRFPFNFMENKQRTPLLHKHLTGLIILYYVLWAVKNTCTKAFWLWERKAVVCLEMGTRGFLPMLPAQKPWCLCFILISRETAHQRAMSTKYSSNDMISGQILVVKQIQWKGKPLGTGEIAEQERTLSALVEDLGTIFDTCGNSQWSVTLVSGDPMISSVFLGYCTHIGQG